MTDTSAPRVLDGIRVFELGIAIVSPSCGKYLAHHGAEVFKVESPTSPDVVRLIGSAWLRDDEERAAAMPDSSPYVPEMNAGKKSIALDLKQDRARAAAHKLVANCDVFIANYTARALVDLGLDYETVSSLRPDIIYVQLPGFGADPSMPYYPFVAWGPNQAPLVGLEELTGHGGREPSGIATLSLPDYTSALHATTAVLCGLEHRDRTGEGVHVDVSQFETTIGLLGPLVMNHDLTGESPERIGNRSLWHAPQGVYPCRGSDELREEWIAISADTDEAWAEITRMAGTDLADDSRFATMDDRMANQDTLDQALAAWTINYDKGDLAARLQKVGVTAHMVSTNEDLLQDEHVKRRQWYDVNPGARFRREVYSTNAVRLRDTPGFTTRAGPTSGEHTVEILTEVAGMTADEVDALIAAGEAFTMVEPDLVLDRPYEDYLHVFFPSEPDTRDLS